MAGGKDQTMVSNVLNSTTPTGSAGIPGTWTALSGTGAMFVRLNSTLSTASASGTQLSGSGYTAKGLQSTTASTASSSGSAVDLPAASAGLSWTNGSGSGWTIESGDLTDNASTPVRAWWWPFNGQPISVANGNIFTIAQNAIAVSDS